MPFVSTISRPRHLSLTLLGGLLPMLALADGPVTLQNEVITATQTAHSELSAPASVSVVTREELDKLPVYSLADAVKYLPGVHINRRLPMGARRFACAAWTRTTRCCWSMAGGSTRVTP